MVRKPAVPEPLLRALAEYTREAGARRPARLGQLEAWESAQLLALAGTLRDRCREGIVRLLGAGLDDPDVAPVGRAVDCLDAEHFAMLLRTEDTDAVLALLVRQLDLLAVEQEIERRAMRGRGVGGQPRAHATAGLQPAH
jgi:hypothetical protein